MHQAILLTDLVCAWRVHGSGVGAAEKMCANAFEPTRAPRSPTGIRRRYARFRACDAKLASGILTVAAAAVRVGTPPFTPALACTRFVSHAGASTAAGRHDPPLVRPAPRAAAAALDQARQLRALRAARDPPARRGDLRRRVGGP